MFLVFSTNCKKPPTQEKILKREKWCFLKLKELQKGNVDAWWNTKEDGDENWEINEEKTVLLR